MPTPQAAGAGLRRRDGSPRCAHPICGLVFVTLDYNLMLGSASQKGALSSKHPDWGHPRHRKLANPGAQQAS